MHASYVGNAVQLLPQDEFTFSIMFITSTSISQENQCIKVKSKNVNPMASGPGLPGIVVEV